MRDLYNYVLNAITHKLNRLHSLTVDSAIHVNLTPEGAANDNIEPNNEPMPTSVPYSERLGGYLHPRDMRRLVTPFSATNEPVIMVRRHVMLLNFDPLRAIVLRDRLLLLVPDGADAILMQLERRLRGGLRELENEVFGSLGSSTIDGQQQHDKNDYSTQTSNEILSQQEAEPTKSPGIDSDVQHNEWEDINQRNFIEMPFELHALDVVLESVVDLLATDALNLCKDVDKIIKSITMDTKAQNNYEKLRVFKDKVKETESRIKGFERALNQVLDEDEDMALMNLSRLITHPERFVFPTSQDILSAESDAPELIIESYLQHAFSASNSLELLNGKIATTEELVEIKLDTIRNRLLFVTTCLTLVTTLLSACSLIGAIFWTNLWSGLEDSPTAFSRIWIGTVSGAFIVFILIFLVFWKKSTWLLQS